MKRRKFGKKFKIWITPEAIRDWKTTSRIASEYGIIDLNQIDNRNKQL